MSRTEDAAAVWYPGEQVFPFIKGRVALYAILHAAGIGPGDEVLIPGFTCVVVAAAVQYTGARPVFYDIDPDTFNGDPVKAATLVGPATRAVLVQHSFGMPADLGSLPAMCRERGIVLIEDCAHAIGATASEGAVGTLGDAAFGSFQWSKPVTTGLGGIAYVNSLQLAEKLARIYHTEFDEPSILKSMTLATFSTLHNRFYQPNLYWLARDTYRWLAQRGALPGSSTDAELLDPRMPERYRERFGGIRERQIRRVLQNLPAIIEHRTAIAARYAAWCEQRNIRIQQGPANTVPAHLRFPLLVDGREQLLEAARRERIELGDWFNAPLHPAEANGQVFGYELGMCPIADSFATRIVNLPTHQHVTFTEAARILAFLDLREHTLISDPRSL